MSSIWNNGISLSVFGESHSEAIGVVIDKLPPGKKIDMDAVQAFMLRRQAKSDGTTTARIEPDIPEILSGLYRGKTTGTPLAFLIKNTNTRSGDYENIQTTVRPGHADYTGNKRYHGANDIRGGGHFSGRLTACLTAAGAVCGQLLEEKNVFSSAYLKSVHRLDCKTPDPMTLTPSKIKDIRQLSFPVIDESQRKEAISIIQNIRSEKDSVGGIIECAVIGMPAGIGSPIFDNLESLVASLIFSIPGVKGLEFGAGFDSARLTGSQNNDSFYTDGHSVWTQTNYHGGILGGISSGMPVVFRTAIKPTPSIGMEQQTVNIESMREETLQITGRHDPFIAARAVPVVEACANIALYSAILTQNGIEG